MERGSPKSCFLFLGEVLCDVNWLSVLSDHFQTSPASTLYPSCPDTLKESHAMLVYLLYMLVFLAKEEQIVSQPVRRRGSKIKFHISVRQSSLHPLFFFYICFLPLAGLPSAQSAGPGHLSPLVPAGPLLIPGRPGLRQHPLPPLSAAL